MRINLNNKLISAILFLPLLFQSGFLHNLSDDNEKAVRAEDRGQETEIKVVERDELDEWIEKLEKYESSIVPEEEKDNYKRIDTNGYYSYSCLQFQLYTFIEYYERWKGVELTEDEAREIIADCELQKDLAKWMIEQNPQNWRHWYNSVVRGLGYPPKK